MLTACHHGAITVLEGLFFRLLEGYQVIIAYLFSQPFARCFLDICSCGIFFDSGPKVSRFLLTAAEITVNV